MRIAINGYGRIGRCVLRAISERGLEKQLEIVAINDLAKPELMVHLTRVDSTHGYFHADPHPGNIFVTPVTGVGRDGSAAGPAWRLTFIDFGMMGEVTDELRDGLRRLLIAVATRDGRGLVESIQDVGMLLPTAGTAEVERSLVQLFDRFGGMGFAQLRKVDHREFRDFGQEFGRVVRALPFQLPESFLLVIRSMSLTSGVCSALDPEFNIWDAIEPYATRLLREEGGNVVRALARDAVAFAGIALRLPQRIDALITGINDGTVAVATPALDRRLRRLERLLRRAVGAVLFAGLLIGGILLLPDDAVLGILLMSASVLPLLYALFAGLGGGEGGGEGRTARMPSHARRR